MNLHFPTCWGLLPPLHLPVRSDYAHVIFKYGVLGKHISCFGTGDDGAVAKSSPNGLVSSHLSTGLNPERFLIFQWVGVRPLHPLLSH